MAQESFLAVARRRLYGLLLIAVVAGLIALSIAIYNKAFSSFVVVTLKADHTGNALIVDSDVKERGIIVGSVKSVRATSDCESGAQDRPTCAVVTLDLDPSRVKDIPSNVTAQILPKTLFGEQYVALNIPAHPAGPIKSGDVIPQDRSQGALETEKVIGDLLPLLTAVDPADLNATLTALAEALHNRGNELGQTLVDFDHYLRQFNPHTKQLADDLGKLGQVSLEYNNLAPDIFATLQNLETSAKTIVQRQNGLNSLLVAGTDASGVLKGFLNDNEQRIIDLTGQTDKIYALLNEYSPEFTCLFAGISHLYDLANTAIYNNRIHLVATIDAQNMGAYKPGQEPKIITGFGPNCFGLPNNIQPVDSKGRFQIPAKYQCLNDGAPLTRAAESPNCKPGTSADTSHALNSAEENALVDSLIASPLHTTPDKVPGIATVLAAPLLRGQRVTVK